jgi:hypothetical protein
MFPFLAFRIVPAPQPQQLLTNSALSSSVLLQLPPIVIGYVLQSTDLCLYNVQFLAVGQSVLVIGAHLGPVTDSSFS